MIPTDPDGNLENDYKCRLEDGNDYGNIQRCVTYNNDGPHRIIRLWSNDQQYE